MNRHVPRQSLVPHLKTTARNTVHINSKQKQNKKPTGFDERSVMRTEMGLIANLARTEIIDFLKLRFCKIILIYFLSYRNFTWIFSSKLSEGEATFLLTRCLPARMLPLLSFKGCLIFLLIMPGSSAPNPKEDRLFLFYSIRNVARRVQLVGNDFSNLNNETAQWFLWLFFLQMGY